MCSRHHDKTKTHTGKLLGSGMNSTSQSQDVASQRTCVVLLFSTFRPAEGAQKTTPRQSIRNRNLRVDRSRRLTTKRLKHTVLVATHFVYTYTLTLVGSQS